ncbi:DUF2142 domain-containing protein [Microbacterium yannicii]|uniref:DUF2142 domain-containing protein n=1 Tax=Microbacterium yannicii TaxID=671622 RepID=UPI000365726F|nr:DUF2142 domain-containing protein [Microbacterium yannicii]
MLFIAIFAMLLAGSLFFPLVSGADEAAHYVYSAAVARGQAGTLEPTVPARIANLHHLAACIAFHPDITAACQEPLGIASNAAVLSQTNAGLYNPVFYAWTGLGSLILPTEYGLYVARALAALFTSLFLAWGLSLTWRRARTPWPTVAAALLLTPMTIYVGMVLNPSAWEIASLFAVTVSGYHVITSTSKSWGEHHSLLLAAGSVLIVTRGLSPLFLVISAVALLLTVPWSQTLHVLRRRSTWVIAIVLAMVALGSVGWVLLHGTNYVGVERPAGLRAGLRGISVFYSNYHEQVTQMYGNLGWLDLPSPQILSILWVLLAGGFVLVSFAAVIGRKRIAILFAFAVCTLLPGILAGMQWSGFGWQGRYTLPLVALLLGLCAWTTDAAFDPVAREDALTSRLLSSFRVIYPGFFALGAIVIAIRAAHRYSVGDPAPWLASPTWTPPVAMPFLAVVFLAGIVVLTASLAARPVGSIKPTPDLDSAHSTSGPGRG